MGTTLSTIPTFNFQAFKWKTIGPYFQRGLSNGVKTSRMDKTIAVACRKANARNRSGILRKESDTPREQVERNDEIVEEPRREKSSSKGQSRLPTPKSKRKSKSSTLDDPNSNDVNDSTGQSKKELASQVTADLVNANPSKPFYPEAWPPSDMIQTHLDKRESQPTTMILARFAPRNGVNFVEIAYSINKTTGEKVFDCSGEMESLFATRDGVEKGESGEQQIDYFLLIFKACINGLKGQVWWNGYSLVFDQTSTKKRVKVSGFELDPSQLLFEFTSVKDVEIHRTSHRIELRCQPEAGSDEDTRWFRIRGLNARAVKVAQLRGNLFTVHIPEYQSVAQK